MECRARFPPYAVPAALLSPLATLLANGVPPPSRLAWRLSRISGYALAMTRRASTLLTGVVLLVALAALAFYAAPPVGYVALVPGPTFNTLGSSGGKQLITIKGAPTSASKGQLRMLTVGEIDDITVWDVVKGWFAGDTAVVPKETVVPPGESQQQVAQQNTDDFKRSQSSAITSALRYEGYPVQLVVDGVTAGDPAAGHLQSGDVITSVNGTKLLSTQDLSNAVQSKPAGTKLTVGYTRGGVAGTADITTAKGSDGHPQIGVSIDPKQPSPLSVDFQLDNVGGPSAGLMFTLGIIDKLDPADLTGGRIIAGTGTIDDDGNVGEIGGIQQKMVGARDAGARYFLAPAGNCAEALQRPVAGLELIKVSTLTDALNALQDLNKGVTPPLCTK
jgi:PDZ domain-containing protein